MITFKHSTEKPPVGTFLCTIKSCFIGYMVQAKGTVGRVTYNNSRSLKHVTIQFSGSTKLNEVYLVGDSEDRLRVAYKNEEKKYERTTRI